MGAQKMSPKITKRKKKNPIWQQINQEQRPSTFKCNLYKSFQLKFHIPNVV